LNTKIRESLTFCSKCGSELSSPDADVCTHCGRLVNEQLRSIPGKSSMVPESDSKWWYLVPIIFGIIGGLILYFAMRENSPKMAKNCLKIGIIVFIVTILVFIVTILVAIILTPFVDPDSEKIFFQSSDLVTLPF